METDNETGFSSSSWRSLAAVANSGVNGQGAVVEAMRRAVVALDASERAASTLGERVYLLNILIMILTLLACLLAAPQAWNAWKTLVR